MPEQWWKDIPGYGGKYQASRLGEIRHVYESGHTRLLTPFRKKSKVTRRRLFIHLTKDGQSKEIAVMKIIAETFKGKTPPGMVLYHINGDVADNCVGNIGFISRSQLGKMTGAKADKRKTVFKVNAAGEKNRSLFVGASGRKRKFHELSSRSRPLQRKNQKSVQMERLHLQIRRIRRNHKCRQVSS